MKKINCQYVILILSFLPIFLQKGMGAELKTISIEIEFETDSTNSQIGPAYGQGLLQHGRAYIGMRRYTIVDRASRA